jgi:diaminopimelate decarboxylase
MIKKLIDDNKIHDFAQKVTTPFYIYSSDKIIENYNSYARPLTEIDSLICYSVKANSNLSILKMLSNNNSGFDVVSKGEIERVLLAGGDAEKIVFSGVGKTMDEIEFGIAKNILCFNVESLDELKSISEVASSLNKRANISIRVNPSIDPKTHPYITTGLSENKFGIHENEIFDAYKMAKDLDNLNIVGIDYHIGSQITDLQPFVDSATKVLEIVHALKEMKINLSHIDVGGGLGITYKDEKSIKRESFLDKLIEIISPTDLKLIVEPGRSIVGDAGLLVTKILNIKNSGDKNFAIVDAAMNDLLRPPLYNAHHRIKNISKPSNSEEAIYDVVGPVCETTDYLGKDRKLSIEKGDYLVVEDVGAYGFSLSSNYNSRPRIAEYILLEDEIKLIRSREDFSNLILDESDLMI